MKQPTRIPVHVRFTGRFIRSYEVVEREPPAEWYAAGPFYNVNHAESWIRGQHAKRLQSWLWGLVIGLGVLALLYEAVVGDLWT